MSHHREVTGNLILSEWSLRLQCGPKRPSSPVTPFLKILDILQSDKANEEINLLGNISFMGEVRDQRKGTSSWWPAIAFLPTARLGSANRL